MAIQRINLGTAPGGTGGDTNRSAFKKIDYNFSASENAASRLVGTNIGNIPDMTTLGVRGIGLGSTSSGDIIEGSSYAEPCGFYRTKFNVAAMPTGAYSLMRTKYDAVTLCDIAFQQSAAKPKLYVRTGYALLTTPTMTPWSEIYHSRSESIYTTTTASSPNVFVTSTGELQRSTSSERYKKDIEHISLNDQQYQAIRQVKPIAYKSTTEVDNPNWTFQSFSAEELAKASPTLVLWEYEETVIDEGTGLQVTRPLAQRRPAGLNLNGIVALQHAVSLKQADLIDAQAKQIKDLTKRITALEAK